MRRRDSHPVTAGHRGVTNRTNGCKCTTELWRPLLLGALDRHLRMNSSHHRSTKERDVSLPRPTLLSPPLSPPCARPFRSGRARAASLPLVVAAAGLVAAYLLANSHGPLAADSLAASRAAALAMTIAAVGAVVAAASALVRRGDGIAPRRAARHRTGQVGRLGRGTSPRGAHHGNRLDRILEAMTRISSERDVDSVMAAAGGAVVELLETRTASPVIARVYRIEGDGMVVVSEHGAAAGATTVGESSLLSADPLILAAVTGDHTLAEAGPSPHRIASPIHAGSAIRAVVLVERRDRAFRDSEVTMVEGLSGIATLAVSNLVRARGIGGAQAEPTDGLTGLIGRAAFERRCREVRESYAIITVDVDHLNQLNNALGREAGDDALRSVARALQASTRERDVVSRSGDDEFTILTVGAATAVVGSVAERMRAAVSELVSGAFPTRVSVGWAVGAAGEDSAEVWARADEALGRAKREGRNRVAGSITGRPAAAPGRGWTTLLSRTLASQQIHPVYQPIVTLPEAHIVAYEGLARPINLDGADSVEEFFATAQRLGVTNELDWICRRAVVRGAEGIRSDAQLYLNIDLSAVSDVDEDVEQMRSLLRWIGRPPANVVLEIADADRFSNLGQLSARVDVYRRAGFKIGIDDTGRPGIGVDLLYATRPEVIKIDASVTNRCEEVEARTLIFECIALAEQIGADVVAEGIEQLSVAAELMKLGVNRAQGFLFGKPESITGPSRELEGEPAVLRAIAATR
jgi:diguanylate cyclase (GGDEF)-like protein